MPRRHERRKLLAIIAFTAKVAINRRGMQQLYYRVDKPHTAQCAILRCVTLYAYVYGMWRLLSLIVSSSHALRIAWDCATRPHYGCCIAVCMFVLSLV